MRVIAGEFRSRKLKTLPGLSTRPTPERLRETLFDILAPHIENTVFLDAYAGTGAVGIEALSRGARRAIFVERGREAIELIRQNLATLGLTERAGVFRGKAVQVIARSPADIVFLDPPYELGQEYEAALAALHSMNPKVVIAQHSSRLKLADAYGVLAKSREVKQGDNVLSFYQLAPGPGAPE